MSDEENRVGNALRQLRKAAGLTLEGLSELTSTSTSTCSRLERDDSNPTFSSLKRFLTGVGASLTDLDRVLAASDPLDEQVAKVRARIRDEPAYQRMAKGMMDRFAGPNPPRALAALIDYIDEHEARADGQEARTCDHEERLKRLEEQLSGRAQPAASVADGEPIE